MHVGTRMVMAILQFFLFANNSQMPASTTSNSSNNNNTEQDELIQQLQEENRQLREQVAQFKRLAHVVFVASRDMVFNTNTNTNTALPTITRVKKVRRKHKQQFQNSQLQE